MYHRLALPLVVCLVMAACDGGSGSDADPTPMGGGAGAGNSAAGDGAAAGVGSEDAPLLAIDTDPGLGEVGVPGDVETPSQQNGIPVEPGTSLAVNTRLLCPSVGESVELSVAAVAPATADGVERERRDVSADVRLSARYGDSDGENSLEVLSQGDGAIAMRMTRRDIVALTLDLEGESSVTVYAAGFDADGPPDVLMRKPVPGGCLYALRLQEPAICATAQAGIGTGRLGTGDRIVTLNGCMFDAPDDLPIVELTPVGG